MNAELIDRLVRMAKEYAAIKEEVRICGIDDRVHLSEEEYRKLFPDLSDHGFEASGKDIIVYHTHEGVKFFALFSPKIKGDLREMI